MSGFKKIGTGNTSTPTSTEQTNTSTGGFKRIEGWTGTKPATPATPAAPTAPKVDISVLRKNLDDAKRAEEVALKNVNDYVSFHVGNLDMQDPAELQGLKDAATEATKKREQLEKDYYAHEDSVEDQLEGFGKAGRAVSTIIAKPFLAVDVAAQTANHAAKGEEMDMDSLAMQKFGRLNEVQGSVTEGMSDTGKFLTNTAMSIGQNLYSLPLNVIMPGMSAVSMGVTSAADKMHELGTQGESATRALVRGGISGGIEAATEAIPLGTLADLIKTGGKGVVKNLLKQGGVEAAEEGISYTANYIADKLAKDPNAKWDWGEFWTSVGSGGLSGLFFGTSGTVVGNIKNGQTGTQGGTDQQPTAGVNLPGAGTNDAGVSVDTAEENILPAGENGQENTASTREAVNDIGSITDEGALDAVYGKYADKTNTMTVLRTDPVVPPEGAEVGWIKDGSGRNFVRPTVTEEQIAKNAGALSDERPVVRLTGKEFPDNDASLVERVSEFFRRVYQNRVANREIGYVDITRRGVKDSTRHGMSDAKGVSFAAVPEVIKYGLVIDTDINHSGRGYDTYTLAAPIEVLQSDGNYERQYVGAIVKRDGNSQRYYLHEVLTQKELASRISTGAADNSGKPGGSQALYTKRLLQSIVGVKGQSAQTGAELSAEITAKGQKYLDRAESKLINELEQALYIPPQRQGSLLKDSVREISLEYLNTGLISEEKLNSLAARAHELGLEVDKAKVSDVVRTKVGEAQGELEVVRRYVQDQMNARRDQATLTMEDVKALYPKVKDARKKAEKAVAKNLLTQDDEMRVNELLRGQISIESLDPTKNNVQGITEVYEAKSEYEQLAKQIRQWNKARKAALKEKADAYLQTANTWRDKLGLAYKIETMERNFRGLVPDRGLAEDIIAEYITPVHKAQAESTRTKNEYRERVRNLNLSRKVDKSKGNIVSEAHAVQLLGEAEDNIRILQRGHTQTRDGKSLEDWQGIVTNLWNENPGLDEAKIRNAVQEFREIYDELFDQMNDARMRNGYEPVNYRSGYFPHFQPGDGDSILAQFGKALGIDTAVTALPTSINGMTHTFKPGIQWFGNAQERLGFNTAYDAVEGFDKYIEGVSDVIHQTDNIQNLRALAAQMRYRTTDEGIRKQVDEVEAMEGISEEDKKNRIDKIYEKAKFALNHFVVELEEYTNLLANKKSMADRNMEQALGRKAYSAIKAIESRVAANMVAINPASWLTNFVPLTQGWATVNSGAMLKGAWDTLKAYKTSDGIVDKSTFLTNRRGSDPLVRTWAQNTSAVLSKPMEYIDHFTADTLVRARYYQNLKEGLSEAAAMDDADSWVAGVMADRSKGSMPTIFNQSNPVTKLFTQFQLEVNNQFGYLFKDLPREMKDKGLAAMAGALFKFFLGAFLFNELYEYFIGRRPALDPIGILNDTAGDLTGYELPNLVELGVGAVTGDVPSFQTEKKGAYEALKNAATGLAEEMPFAGGLLGGGRVPISSALPDLSKLGQALVDSDWSTKKRVTTGLNELIKPLMYVAPPFGGGQLKKVAQGTEAIIRKGSYSVDADGNDLLQYPVYRDTPTELAESVLTSALFGKSSLKTAQDWVESGFDSLGAKETAVYKAMTEDGISGRDAFAILKEMRGANGKAEKLDIVAQSGMSEETAKDLAGLIMGTEMRTESGNPTQYAKLVQAMDTALSAREAIEMQIAGIDMGEFLEMTGAGVDAKTARDLMLALAEAKIDWLPIGENKLRQYRAVTDSNMSDDDQMEAMGVLMGEAEYSKLQTGYDYGVTPKIYVKYKEAVYSRGDVNTQAEIKAVIDAMNIEDVQVKATLWQMANKGWSPKNNPYSATVGAAVKDALG